MDLSLCKMRLRRAHQLEKELDRLLTESPASVPTSQQVDLAIGITRLRVMARQELQRAASDAKERRRP